jgi:hypothetical protein
MTRTEEFVYNLCNRTFLSLWSFPNPIGKKGKELCDVLIICEPDIIIFSVKEINIKDSGEFDTDTKRWMERAIDSSVKQIYGAERFIENTNRILLSDRNTEIELKKNNNWKIHRIAVSFGRGEKFPIQYGDFGKGFVHVFDERSIQIVLHELDTLKDFVNYLQAKENFIKNRQYPFSYGEEDIVAYYLSNNFSLPNNADFVIFHDDLYSGLSNDKEYQKIMADLKVSYVWDNLIEILIGDFNKGILITNISRADFELAIRQMAREDRNSRKILSEQFLDFIGCKSKPVAKARLIKSLNDSNVVYLFVLGDYDKRDLRFKELTLRSFVARSKFDCDTIVGIATEKYNPKGYSLDISYTYLPEFSDDLKKKAEVIINELGYFKNPQQRNI